MWCCNCCAVLCIVVVQVGSDKYPPYLIAVHKRPLPRHVLDTLKRQLHDLSGNQRRQSLLLKDLYFQMTDVHVNVQDALVSYDSTSLFAVLGIDVASGVCEQLLERNLCAFFVAVFKVTGAPLPGSRGAGAGAGAGTRGTDPGDTRKLRCTMRDSWLFLFNTLYAWFLAFCVERAVVAEFVAALFPVCSEHEFRAALQRAVEIADTVGDPPYHTTLSQCPFQAHIDVRNGTRDTMRLLFGSTRESRTRTMQSFILMVPSAADARLVGALVPKLPQLSEDDDDVALSVDALWREVKVAPYHCGNYVACLVRKATESRLSRTSAESLRLATVHLQTVVGVLHTLNEQAARGMPEADKMMRRCIRQLVRGVVAATARDASAAGSAHPLPADVVQTIHATVHHLLAGVIGISAVKRTGILHSIILAEWCNGSNGMVLKLSRAVVRELRHWSNSGYPHDCHLSQLAEFVGGAGTAVADEVDKRVSVEVSTPASSDDLKLLCPREVDAFYASVAGVRSSAVQPTALTSSDHSAGRAVRAETRERDDVERHSDDGGMSVVQSPPHMDATMARRSDALFIEGGSGRVNAAEPGGRPHGGLVTATSAARGGGRGVEKSVFVVDHLLDVVLHSGFVSVSVRGGGSLSLLQIVMPSLTQSTSMERSLYLFVSDRYPHLIGQLLRRLFGCDIVVADKLVKDEAQVVATFRTPSDAWSFVEHQPAGSVLLVCQRGVALQHSKLPGVWIPVVNSQLCGDGDASPRDVDGSGTAAPAALQVMLTMQMFGCAAGCSEAVMMTCLLKAFADLEDSSVDPADPTPEVVQDMWRWISAQHSAGAPTGISDVMTHVAESVQTIAQILTARDSHLLADAPEWIARTVTRWREQDVGGVGVEVLEAALQFPPRMRKVLKWHDARSLAALRFLDGCGKKKSGVADGGFAAASRDLVRAVGLSHHHLVALRDEAWVWRQLLESLGAPESPSLAAHGRPLPGERGQVKTDDTTASTLPENDRVVGDAGAQSVAEGWRVRYLGGVHAPSLVSLPLDAAIRGNWRPECGMPLLFIVHGGALGVSHTEAVGTTSPAVHRMASWLKCVLRSRMSSRLKEYAVRVSHAAGVAEDPLAAMLSRASVTVDGVDITPVDEMCVLHALANDCPLADVRAALLAVTQLRLSDEMQEFLRRRNGYGMRVFPRTQSVSRCIKSCGASCPTVDLAALYASQSESDASLYARITAAVDASPCFVVIVGLLRISDQLWKWCAELTKRHPWLFLFFEDTQVAWLLPENLDRLVRGEAHAVGDGAGGSELESTVLDGIDEAAQLHKVVVRFPLSSARHVVVPPTRAHLLTSRLVSAFETRFMEQYGRLIEGAAHFPLLLSGAPGIGKTVFIADKFMKRGYSECGRRDRSDPRRIAIVESPIDGSSDVFCRTALVDVLAMRIASAMPRDGGEAAAMDASVVIVVDEVR